MANRYCSRETTFGKRTSPRHRVRGGVTRQRRLQFRQAPQRLTFDSSVLGKLLQNARRAGATRVDIVHDPKEKTLTVSDDGIGVGSTQSLLAVAESGWDQGIQDLESPYGMGFMSALYAARGIEVVSRGRRAAFDTADALGFREIRVEEVEDAAPPRDRRHPARGRPAR